MFSWKLPFDIIIELKLMGEYKTHPRCPSVERWEINNERDLCEE